MYSTLQKNRSSRIRIATAISFVAISVTYLSIFSSYLLGKVRLIQSFGGTHIGDEAFIIIYLFSALAIVASLLAAIVFWRMTRLLFIVSVITLAALVVMTGLWTYLDKSGLVIGHRAMMRQKDGVNPSPAVSRQPASRTGTR